MPKTYTVKQAAEILGYCTNSIYTFLKQKSLKGIRVGKGKYLIPQEEINRLLSSNETAEKPKQESETLTGSTSTPLKIPGLFNWFTGIASIILGSTLFLFNKIDGSIALAPYIKWLLPLKVSLITAGIGFLISDIVGNKYLIWRRVFRFILFFSYLMLAIILGLIGDFLGTAAYGSLALILFLRFFVNLSGVNTFFLYVFLLFLTAPAGLLFSKIVILPEQLKFLSSNSLIFSTAGMLAVVTGLLFLKWASRKNKILYWLVLRSIPLAVIIVISSWNAQCACWDKALFFIFVGVTIFFAQWWKSFPLPFRRNRLAIFTIFSIIMTIFLVTTIIIYFMQRNLVEYAQEQLIEKELLGRLIVNQTLDSVETTLKSTANNPILISALENPKENQDLFVYLVKPAVENNGNLNSILLLDKTGNTLARYPYNLVFEGKNFGHREYFKQALVSQEIYVSDNFEAVTEKPAVVLSKAVLDKENNVVGILVDFLELNAFSNKLQQVATNNRSGEYFIILDDRQKNYIVHPKADLIGKRLEEGYLDNQVFIDVKGIAMGYNYQGLRTLQTFDKSGKNDWIVVIQAPMNVILKPTQATIYSFYLATILSIIAIVFLFLITYPKIFKESGKNL